MLSGKYTLYDYVIDRKKEKERKSIRKQCLEEELEILKDTYFDYICCSDKNKPQDTTYLQVYKHGDEFSDKLKQAVIKVYLDEIKTL